MLYALAPAEHWEKTQAMHSVQRKICDRKLMKKIISLFTVLSCLAAMLCGCKGKGDSDRLSNSYTISDKTDLSASQTSEIISDESNKETGSVSVNTKKSESKKTDSTVTVYDEVKADGEAEDIILPSESTNAQNSDTSQADKKTDKGDNSSEISSEDNKDSSSEKSSDDNKSSDTASKDTMSGWSIWK